ncbi:putative transposase for insertion sequence element [Rhodococcus ruber BKS 20-38]|uniref:Putative transposase for insertion sequence element n=1 Tax=Rhodococcus ruber BKS 20-38 TaxID=1278076 RepID=M3A4B7_9NOCA|nr:putative transposase for insertion sequence element [Rhodococcus ruber BKS 20-38]
MVQRRGLELTGSMNNVDAAGLPALRPVAAGRRRDRDGITAGSALEHNSGPVLGHVNKIEMLKRQMYGHQPRSPAKSVIHLKYLAVG